MQDLKDKVRIRKAFLKCRREVHHGALKYIIISIYHYFLKWKMVFKDAAEGIEVVSLFLTLSKVIDK